MSNELVSVCAVAFLMVFLILTVLALLMRLIIFFFPQKTDEIQPALVAALATAVHTVFPGTKIHKIKEQK